ncbi:MAG: hypothetical protein RIR37_329, partial [Verrucomicrobiota bacterium]
MTTTSYFNTTDYVFMGLYVLVLIFLGFYLQRLA